MKTSEFRKYLEEKGWDFKEDKNCFDILNLGLVFKDSNSIDICIMYCQNDLFENIYKYARTPLEEREEEKKYYLMFPKDFIYSKNSCLNFDRDKKRYCKDCKRESINYKTKFTQKEIDEMPFDTKFFEKVESE